MPTGRVLDRFWSRVVKSDLEDGCWLWTGPVQSGDYGTMGWNGRSYLAHRVAYTLEVGPIPDGLHLDHLCRVRHCVRPSHLEPVTCAENNRRAEPYRERRPGTGFMGVLPDPLPRLGWGDGVLYKGEIATVIRSSKSHVDVVFEERAANRVRYHIPRAEVEHLWSSWQPGARGLFW